MTSAAASDAGPAQQTATFRMPATGQIAVISVALGCTPIAWAEPGLQAIYVVPVLLSWWIFWARTVVGPEGIRAYMFARPTRLSWEDVKGLRVQEKRWVKAVRTDGSELTLPAVRTRDLSLVALASGGRVGDPQE